jgi:hypothetical protein
MVKCYVGLAAISCLQIVRGFVVLSLERYRSDLYMAAEFLDQLVE